LTNLIGSRHFDALKLIHELTAQDNCDTFLFVLYNTHIHDKHSHTLTTTTTATTTTTTTTATTTTTQQVTASLKTRDLGQSQQQFETLFGCLLRCLSVSYFSHSLSLSVSLFTAH